MKHASLTLAFIAGLLATVLACGRSAPTEDGYAGTWVMKVGEHVMIVMMLEAQGDGFGGSVQHPAHFQSDGFRYSDISGGTVSERIVSTSREGDALRIVTEGAGGQSDRSELVMRLVGADGSSLAMDGWPLEPWPLARHRGPETPRVFEGWEAGRSYSVEDTSAPPNAEMQAIYEADQAARQGRMTPEQLDAMRPGDAERRAQTRAVIDAGALHTGEDFQRAAVVFQHGEEPDDFLYAHMLATIAVVKGDATAAWIGAATLDRYLQSIGQPQVYGTQFTWPTTTGPSDSTFSEPFNRELISDALRRQAGVASLADQLARMRKMQDAAPPADRAR